MWVADELFNSHPHKEDDYLGEYAYLWVQFFNSHPHKEDDDAERAKLFGNRPFQLTSSQGG